MVRVSKRLRNTAVDEGERSASRPVRFIPKERSNRINCTKMRLITCIRRLIYDAYVTRECLSLQEKFMQVTFPSCSHISRLKQHARCRKTWIKLYFNLFRSSLRVTYTCQSKADNVRSDKISRLCGQRWNFSTKHISCFLCERCCRQLIVVLVKVIYGALVSDI